MHIKTVLATLLLAIPPAVLAQLSPSQKEEDFRVLAALYSKRYGPYEWKKQATGFDMLRIAPWLERVRQSKDDLDFYEICVEYVASLQDSHVGFFLPSNFVAQLGFSADIFDGKVLIDAINRVRLPAATYPFAIGDEVVSVDGKAAAQLVTEFGRYITQGNPRSTRRQAAALIPLRPQSRIPRAAELGESAVVVIRRQSGAEETYTIPWIKTGTPVKVGPVPSPRPGGPLTSSTDSGIGREPDYMAALREIQYSGVSGENGVLGYGARTPIFAMPAGFVQRLGTMPADFFFSGTYTTASGQRIGFIRIPNYGSLAAAVLAQFEREIAFFEQNTDGLVIDQMRNTGGFLCFGENVVARLVSGDFQPTGYQLRASRSFLNGFFNSLNNARAFGAEQWVIDLYEVLFRQMNQAYSENRGLTGPVPVCTPSPTRQGATDGAGRSIAYSKPIVMLVDEFSTSTGDSVPAMLQDAKRATIFGWRTNGAGGTNTSYPTGAYSEGVAGMTLGLMTRTGPIATAEYPAAPYIENIGVRPDIEYDFMTRDNLLQQGRPFVAAFTEAIVNLIRR